MYYYGVDFTYIILVLPAVIFAFWAQANVSGTFRKCSEVPSRMSGYDTARSILNQNGLQSVAIEQLAGGDSLNAHYDPRSNTIRLSPDVYNGRNAAASGVAAHEAGHAVQYAQYYAPIKIRTAILPVSQIGSMAATPLIILGFVLSFEALVYIGIACFAAATLFQLVTLPVEFNASRRAINALSNSGTLGENELDAAKKVLRAAALTYVAALAVSLASLLRLILISNRRRK